MQKINILTDQRKLNSFYIYIYLGYKVQYIILVYITELQHTISLQLHENFREN